MWREDTVGTITCTDFESQQGDPITVTIRRPTVGGLRRLKTELRRLGERDVEYYAELREKEEAKEPADRDEAALNATFVEHTHESAIAWWQLALRGDDTFRGLADPAPPEPDLWPPYLTAGTMAWQAISHWEKVPLARGETPPEMLSTNPAVNRNSAASGPSTEP